MAPKSILFVDFDGTICHDKYWRSLPSELYEQVQDLIFRNDRTVLNAWMRGEHTAEEINRLVADAIGMPYEALWELFVQDCRTMHVDRNILDRLSALKERYVVILVTGNMDSFSRFTVPALKLDTYFDHINNSFFAGKLKTDDGGRVFREYAEALSVPLAECIVIDDSPKTCELFAALGGTALQISPERDITFYLKAL